MRYLFDTNSIIYYFNGLLQNLEQYYKGAVDAWAIYDSVGDIPLLLAWGENQ